MENLVNVNEGIIVSSGIFFLALRRGCQFETSKVESAPETALECFFSGTTRLEKKKKEKKTTVQQVSLLNLFFLFEAKV